MTSRVVYFLAGLFAAGLACSTPTGNGTGLPLGAASVQLDVPFCAGGVLQRIDLYFPPQRKATPTPVVLHFHGGGWVRGDKATGPWFLLVGEEMIERGYVVASANYRLSPTPWPAMIEDATCAIRHLRDNAATYGIDPNRIGVWGNSAGGHLAALVGMTDAFSGAGLSTRPQAVVAMYGIHDLTAQDFPFITRVVIEQVFGSEPDPGDPILVQASPVNHASAEDAPMLLIHGTEDLVVPLSQSQSLFDRLAQAGAEAAFVTVENAGHELEPSGGPIDPSEGEITDRIADFFDDQL